MSDNSKTYTSSIGTVNKSNDHLYLDIDIDVICPDGGVWRKTFCLNTVDGEEWESDTLYAESKNDCFYDAESPPQIIQFMLDERIEEAKQLLRAEHTRQTSVKGHAEEMLGVLKAVYEFMNRCGYTAQHILNTVKHTIDKVEGRK